MVLRAFMDESIDRDGTWVMAGHIADVASWASFSAEWEQMLPLAVLADDGTYQFKMSEMAVTPERMTRVPGFYRVIEKHALHSLSCRINAGELNRAIDRIDVRGRTFDWENWRDPYVAAFRVLMDKFHGTRPEIALAAPTLSQNAVVDFYFDEHANKKKIRGLWDTYIKTREPAVRALYGQEPLFKDDRIFLPLQAADLWAWWVRKWCAEGRLLDRLRSLDFGSWKGAGLPRTHISLNEDQWVQGLADMVAVRLPPLTPIFDKKTGKVIRMGGA